MVTTAAPFNGAKQKFDTYKANHESCRKPGLMFWNEFGGTVLYWSDLVRVGYQVNGDEDEAPLEKVTLGFHAHFVTVRGHRLEGFFFDCQKHIADVVRVSPDEEILGSSKGPIITRITIDSPKKAKGAF